MQVKLLTFLLLLAVEWGHAQNDDVCGGLLIQESGEISYKVNSTYENHESCVWTVRSGLSANLSFTLVKDGFEYGYDYVYIATFDDYERANLQVVALLDAASTQPVIVNGPVAFVIFYSDASFPGTGFRLQFEGTGGIRKDLDHLQFSHGLAYPNETTEYRYPPITGLDYRPWEFSTYVIQPPRPSNQPVIPSYLVFNEIDIEESVDCTNDSLDPYIIYHTGLLPTAPLCLENWNGTESVGSINGPWILIFRSNGNVQGAGFKGSFRLTYP